MQVLSERSDGWAKGVLVDSEENPKYVVRCGVRWCGLRWCDAE